MVRINLLPWREQLREERKRQFFMALAVTAAIAVLLVFVYGKYLNNQIDSQEMRNQYLKRQIAVMDQRLKVIAELKAQKEELLSRMRVIEGLQSNRQILAKLLDQFVRTLPDGVFFSSLSKKGKQIDINGITLSNNRIAQLMRNFKNSAWLTKPSLTEIVQLNTKDPTDKTSKFILVVQERDVQDGENKQ